MASLLLARQIIKMQAKMVETAERDVIKCVWQVIKTIGSVMSPI
jgi:hypothetical protein